MAAVFLIGTVASASNAQSAGTGDPSDLVSQLQNGGLIMYVRHAATNHDEADKNISDLSRCDLQRNLSEQGKEESRTMAEAMARFEMPIGQVFSSPYCRTIDTAVMAFGRYHVVDDLRATFFTNKEETDRINEALRLLLSREPELGNNTVIVGHTANLDDVTQVWPKPEGVVHVFRPLGENGFEHLGRITPMDWLTLLAAQ